MIGQLPDELEIGGKSYKINADFRVVLNIFEAFGDPELTDKEKLYICLSNLYCEPKNIPKKYIQEAAEKAYWFVGGGDSAQNESHSNVRLLDWKQDEFLYFPAINKTAGFEVRAVKFLHWWTFLGYFNEIGEGLFSQVLHIRSKKSKGRKLEKWENEFIRDNKNLVEIKTKYTKEEQENQKKILALFD